MRRSPAATASRTVWWLAPVICVALIGGPGRVSIAHAAPVAVGVEVQVSVSTSTGGRAATWRSPVLPLRVQARFDPPEHRWLPGHRGVDLRTREGATVRAAGSGRVVFAGSLAGRGVVSIDHGGLRTTYEPVLASVEAGEQVRVGAPIGVIATGTGHCGSGRCLHLGLRRDRTYLDPMLLLGRTSARLRPW